MNRNLKFAIAAAIASLGVTGQAHALTNSTSTTSGSLFLYAFEDRTANSDGHQQRHLRSGPGLGLRYHHQPDLRLQRQRRLDHLHRHHRQPRQHPLGRVRCRQRYWRHRYPDADHHVGRPRFRQRQRVEHRVTNYNAEITLYGSNAGFNTADHQ